jgi:adenylate cyclase class 2
VALSSLHPLQRITMPIELEAKMKVPDHTAVRDRLRALGAKALGKTFELNTFFDTPDQSLRNSDRGLRIRHERHLNTGDTKSILTMKGPAGVGQLKSREELQLTVSDADQLTAILAALGYHPVLSFEKRRETWSLDNCLIELDELPHLGLFVEIEGPSENAIMSLRTKLNLSNNELVPQSYSAQCGKYLQEHRQSDQRMKFPS